MAIYPEIIDRAAVFTRVGMTMGKEAGSLFSREDAQVLFQNTTYKKTEDIASE